MIVDNDATDSQLLSITTAAASSYFRLAGLTFQGGNGGVKYAVVGVGGFSQKVRVDHNHFNSTTYNPSVNPSLLLISNWTYGVVDHNLFDMAAATQGVWSWEDAYNNDSFGDGSWADVTGLGSANFVFIENNIFNGELYANDCTRAGRQVFRFNTLNGNELQTHPTGGSGRVRGCRAFEVYQNTFVASNSNPVFNAFFLSSGTGVIWGNVAPTGYETFASLHNVRSDSSDYSQTATPNGWGYCGTTFNGTGSAWDQSSTASTGYACLDQIGRGQGKLLSGDFPNVVNSATGSVSWPSQALEPVYEWLDTWSQVPGYGYSFFNTFEPSVLVANRDYYQYKSSFDGTSGVGSGTLASRPSTCTVGVAYWATDQGSWNQSGSGGQGELFTCTATNTWTLYYTPYTYPHPLDMAPAPPTPPSATVVVQ